ncbi:MAG: choloylglycine hydrolase family protein [Candidatus Omnitrophica bacterium]|nr:choloylglycine hydrolase family protein [Candidatus Omnitrophota bacterium]
MKKPLVFFLGIAFLASALTVSAEACTSFILKAEDNSPVYGRTCEWGVFDLKSNLVLVPRNFLNTSNLDNGKQGMSWKSKYGFVAINALDLSYYLDGMNETGLTVGGLYMPGFTEYQTIEEGKESSTLNAAELISYILGEFGTVDEVKAALPNLRVVDNKDIAKAFGAPTPLHFVVTDNAGDSIVIEYVDGKLNIYDNTIGVMTNSPPYYWHLLNLRNYTNLTPLAPGPGTYTVDGVNFTPFGMGAGMTGLPGDYSGPSRFVRAFFYTHTSLPMADADVAINQASRILDNFNYPKGFVREEQAPDKHVLNLTAWTVIGDIKNKRYYWWTEYNRQMRMVDLGKLNFDGAKVIAIPLDKTRSQNIDDRTGDFQN